MARMAVRSTWAARRSDSSVTLAAAAARSAAGTRPRWRDGASIPASRGSTPSTGSPVASMALVISSEWRREPALFKITPAQLDLRIEGVEAVHDRRRRTRDLRDVQHQDHRRRDQTGHVRGGGEPVAADLPVEQAHHPFDHGDVGGLRRHRPVQQQRDDLILGAQVRVEVAAGATGGQGVVAGVDVVRSDLEAGHLQALGAQRAHQPGGHRRLPVARAWRGHHQPRQAYHSMPRWPFWPSSNGCLILVISVTSWAISINRGSARRPVMITC